MDDGVANWQERVGVLGARSRIDLEGVNAFDPRSILGVVFIAHDTGFGWTKERP